MAITLTSISRNIKSEIFLIFLGIVTISLISITIYSLFKTPIKTSGDTPPQNIAWNGITPGLSTREDVLSKLGTPIETNITDNAEVLKYSSSSIYIPHQIHISNGITKLIQEQNFENIEGKLFDIINTYGQPEAIVYGKHGKIALGHFWGTKGLLVFANNIDGNVLESWYFPPQTLEVFLQSNPAIKLSPPKGD